MYPVTPGLNLAFFPTFCFKTVNVVPSVVITRVKEKHGTAHAPTPRTNARAGGRNTSQVQLSAGAAPREQAGRDERR